MVSSFPDPIGPFDRDYMLAKEMLRGVSSLSELSLKLDISGKKFKDVYAASWGMESFRVVQEPNGFDNVNFGFIEKNRKEILDLFNSHAEKPSDRYAINPEERRLRRETGTKAERALAGPEPEKKGLTGILKKMFRSVGCLLK